MFPWFCLFSLSFQWEEVQKFPGTLFLGTFFSYFRWFFSLWSVASNSRRIRDVAPKSRYTPPKSRCRTFLRTALSHFLSFAARGGPRGGWRAGGGYRGIFGFRKRIALQGGVAATVTPVALLCATKTHTPLIKGWRYTVTVGAWNRYNVANWRSNLETVHIFAILRGILAF